VIAVVVSGETEPLGLALPVVGHVPEEVIVVLTETTELPPRLRLQLPLMSMVWPPLAQFEVAGELNHCAPVRVHVVPVGVEHWQVPRPQVRPSTALPWYLCNKG
jgi:hypothetical protein